MRVAAAVVAALAIVALVLFWSVSRQAVMTQARDAASQQLRTASHVLSLREELRLRNVGVFATELSANPEIRQLFAARDYDGVAQALTGTSFGEGGKSVVLLERRGERVWANEKPATGPVRSKAVARAMEGQTQFLFLHPEDVALADLGFPRGDTPMFVVVAPLREGKDTQGAVVIAEPLTPDFFQHLLQIAAVRVSFPGAAANYGNVPDEAMKVDSGPPQFVETATGPVFAQRIEFRVAPSFVLAQPVASVDASGVVERRRPLNLYFGAALLTVLMLAAFAVRRRP